MTCSKEDLYVTVQSPPGTGETYRNSLYVFAVALRTRIRRQVTYWKLLVRGYLSSEAGFNLHFAPVLVCENDEESISTAAEAGDARILALFLMLLKSYGTKSRK